MYQTGFVNIIINRTRETPAEEFFEKFTPLKDFVEPESTGDPENPLNRLLFGTVGFSRSFTFVITV